MGAERFSPKAAGSQRAPWGARRMMLEGVMRAPGGPLRTWGARNILAGEGTRPSQPACPSLMPLQAAGGALGVRRAGAGTLLVPWSCPSALGCHLALGTEPCAPQWDGTAVAGSAALPEPPLLPSPPSHPLSGQGQEPPPNCCGHGSGRSWCACVCWDPGDNGSPCFGAKPCAAFGVRAEQEPPPCPGCPGAGSTGKALLGQRGHGTPWNRAGTRAAFPRSQAAHRNPAGLRPLLIRLSPSPWGMGRVGIPTVLCWGLVAGLWGHGGAISHLSRAKVLCPSPSGTIPLVLSRG